MGKWGQSKIKYYLLALWEVSLFLFNFTLTPFTRPHQNCLKDLVKKGFVKVDL